MRSPLLRTALIAVTLLVGTAVTPAGACTTSLLQHGDEVAIAKSYDFPVGDGLIIVNPRGVAKHAMGGGAYGSSLAWVSSFGSVTFNQYGREMPAGGMNEAGLVVEVMWLDETQYEAPDKRPALPDLQWIQYQLDTRASVAELLAHAGELRVASRTARVHFLACDRTGACAAIEFVRGAMVVTAGAAMPWKTLTNNTYADSCAFVERRGQSGGQASAQGPGSLERFDRAAALSRRAAARDAGRPGLVDDAFALLDSVSQGSGSVWNIVYDPRGLVVRYRTHAQPRVKTIELAAFAFACNVGALALDVDADRWGRVAASFSPCTEGVNRDLIRRIAHSGVVPLPAGAVDYLARFPESFRCAP
jgi:choloylglycine hydrolase